MKGITPVIAIILLLLITISMVGFAFVWFQRVAQTATEGTESQLQEQLSQQGQKVRIDNIDDTNNAVSLFHSGTVTSDTSKVSVFINDARVTCAWSASGSWAPGTSKDCTVAAGFSCSGTGATRIKATAPGNQDATSC